MSSASHAILLEELSLGGAGLRVAIKDSIDVAGSRTTAASAALAQGDRATRHADVVAALIAADWRIIGKANMHELAYGVTGVNAWTGTPPNPLYPGRISGGSSSGSAAAVAAGIADVAIGTDTGGSIRMPAACCGVVGFKPSFGRVSRRGVYPAESTLDCVGPFARSVSLIERTMAIINPGFVPVEHAGPIRLGRLKVQADSDVVAAFDRAVGGIAATLAPVTLDLESAFAANMAIIAAETWAAFGHLVPGGLLGADVQARLRAAADVTAEALFAAERVRIVFRQAVDAALGDHDALVLPTLPMVPPRVEDAGDAGAALRLTAFLRPFNLSGHPAITLPIETAEGLPAGVQLVGRIGGDAELCALARSLAGPLGLPEQETSR